MDGWTAVFGPDHGLSPAQECARAVLVLAYGYAAVRLIGRRLFGKWSPLDIVVSIVIGSNLSRTLTGNAPLIGTLLATSVLLAIYWAAAYATSRSGALSRVIEGRPATLVEDGAKDASVARRWGISEADVNEALRQKGLERLDEARALILEPSGSISVIKR